MPDRQAERGQGLVRLGPLHGEHRVVVVLVGDGQPLGRSVGEQPDDLGGVGRVGNEKGLVVGQPVPDQVIDHAAFGVAQQRVLGLPHGDLAGVVGDGRVEKVDGAGALDSGLAEVADVEDADPVAHGLVLAHDARVLQRHRPAAELGELGPQRLVPVVQWRLLQLRHHALLHPTLSLIVRRLSVSIQGTQTVKSVSRHSTPIIGRRRAGHASVDQR